LPLVLYASICEYNPIVKTDSRPANSRDVPLRELSTDHQFRQGWEEAFREAAGESEEPVLLDSAANRFDAEERPR
jgi:hypothetical protein